MSGRGEAVPRFKPKGMLERSAAADLWKHTLSRIPTVYGRLTYLATLRDQNSGNYRHHGLSAAFGREESNRALRESHEQTFGGWLNLSLEEQHADLSAYLGTLEEPLRAVLEYWLRSRAYRNQPPASARTADRQLFYRNLEALLVVLKYASADAGPAQGSSPPASPAR
jgi:hypothetical protein